ncbi:sigma 54-interacting transcriptional regulator [Romboutsia sp.]|uniref:sigma 54-interacting transcriptional regulator n=1 Tax=Romboutsia sp. TaxID=1965302 RepID=UPI003F360C19
MEKIIGIIASDIELKEKIEALYPDDIENGNIIMDIIDVELLEKQGQILAEKGAQVIIGRGGGYKLILDTVNVPIIPLNIKMIELLRAIKIAESYSKKIVLILGDDEVYFDYSKCKDLINTEIKEEWFKSKFEIRNKVTKYIQEKEDVVIVGSGIACSFARQYKIEHVFINASRESIKEAIDYAKKLINTINEEKFNNEVLRNILDGIKDGVIAVDRKGKIIIYNESIEKILKKKESEVLNKHILDVFPNMNWLMECLHKNENIKRKIRYLNNLEVNTRAKLIEIDDETYGVVGIIQDITKIQKLERQIRLDLNKKGLYARYTFNDFIYKDECTKELIEEAKKIGRTDYTTLLYGESGSGKEMIAQSMHNISNRKDKPFVAINCATISENLLESELFGYEEGAFTGAKKGGKLGLFELAHEGTVFLDEINSLPINFQIKLLRVIEEREIMRIGSNHIIPLNIRIIAATNESLRKKISENTFRDDLFYRLSSLEIDIPPLRDRKKDIILLFNNFVNQILESEVLESESVEKHSKSKLSDKDIRRLENYNWPGNIRELKNVAQKYVITEKIKIDYEEQLNLTDRQLDKLDYSDFEENNQNNKINIENYKIDIKEVNKYVEEKIIAILLQQGLSKTQIAQILGISRTALWKKFNKEKC